MLLDKLYIIGVPDLEEQYRRPFELGSSGDMLDALENALDETGVGNVRPSALDAVMERGLRYSSDRRESGRLVGGWKRSRYRFIAIVEIAPISKRLGTGERLIVIGYTESSERAIDAHSIPADMEFYINGVIGLRDKLIRSGGRDRVESDIIKPFQILRGADGRNNRDYLSRPTEVFKEIQIQKTYGADEESFDTRNIFKGKVKTSDIRNNVRGAYLSKLIRADHDGFYTAATYSSSQFASSRDAAAADSLMDPSLTNNDFTRALTSINRDFNARAVFRYEDLIDFTDRRDMQSLDDITTVGSVADNDYDYDSISWRGADAATVAAYTITRELPSLMLDVLITTVSFMFDTSRIDNYGDPEWDVSDWTMYVDGISSSDRIAETLVRSFLQRIIKPLTRDFRTICYARIDASVEGMVTIEMEWDQGRMEKFNYPAFLDGVVSSNYTADRNNIRRLADSYTAIRKDVITPALERETELDEREW